LKPILEGSAALVKARKTDGGFYEGYASFAGVLRTWLIAYGIGGPVLLITNENVSKKISASGLSRDIALLFLSGVALQVIVAFLYKGAMWYLYMGEEVSERITDSRCYKISSWLSEAFWLEMLFDLGSIVLFAIATMRVLELLTVAATAILK
jgi:hypothetical protein